MKDKLIATLMIVAVIGAIAVTAGDKKDGCCPKSGARKGCAVKSDCDSKALADQKSCGKGACGKVKSAKCADKACCGVCKSDAGTKDADCKASKCGTKCEMKAQTTCPVMGGKIDKEQYVDVKGYRVYTCCAGCKGKIEANPSKYIAKIKANGESPRKLEQKQGCEGRKACEGKKEDCGKGKKCCGVCKTAA